MLDLELKSECYTQKSSETMDISQLWSTHPVVTVVIVALVVLVLCCLGYCCLILLIRCLNNNTPRKSAYHGTNLVTPCTLESGSLPLRPRTKGDYTLVDSVESDCERESDVPKDRPNFPTPTVRVNQERPVTQLPSNFYDFIIDKIIPDFIGQRSKGYQFAVVVLLSENDFDNISQTSFTPSDCSGKPILDNNFSIMPQSRADYGNYIVARPISNSYHSEEAIFEQYSVNDSPFSHLWNKYVERNHGAYPKCILIYSWNLPCSRCTDVIIRSLGEEPYNRVSVIVAHTQVWQLETALDRSKSTNKLFYNSIKVQKVVYPTRIPPANNY